jgi:hypothetical protein
MFSDPDFAVRSQVVDKRGRLLGEGSRTRKADEAIKRWVGQGAAGEPAMQQQPGSVPAAPGAGHAPLVQLTSKQQQNSM